MIKIKCVFPYNYYSLRHVMIFNNEKKIAMVGHNEEITIEEDFDNLFFKLDYHKTILKLSSKENVNYVILYFKIRNTFPLYIIDVMFKNALKAVCVSKKDFENFSLDFYKIKKSDKLVLNIKKKITLLLYSILSSIFIFESFEEQVINESDSNFLFLIGLFGFLTVGTILYSRKKITELAYKVRILSFLVSSAILLFFLKFNITYQLFMFSTLIFITIITFVKFKKHNTYS